MVEVLVASAALIVALLTTLFAMTCALQGLRENNARLRAQTAAQQEMELLKNQTFAQIAALPAASSFAGSLPQACAELTCMTYVCNYNPTTGTGNYNPTTDTCDAGGDPNIKQVTVTVSLDASRQYRFVNLFSNS